MFYVKKTKYIYDSEIYHHYTELRSEYEGNFTLDSILPEQTKRVLFIVIYSLTLFLCIIGNNKFSGKVELSLLLCILGVIFIIDVLYEFIRTSTNTTDFTKVKSKIPSSLRLYNQQKRFMYTIIMQKFVQYGPACINGIKTVVAGVGVVEVGYPTVFADGQLGPLTKFVANDLIYKNQGLECPIQTQEDMIYESHRKVVEAGVVDGFRSYNHMPKRTFSFCSEVEREDFLVKNRIIK